MHLSALLRRPALLAAVAAFILPSAVPLLALADTQDGAGVGVARISLIQGSVAVQRGDATTPSAAAINAPVLGGDYVTTGDGSRAEVQIDGGTLVRLGDNVQMRFTHLDADQRAIQVAEGTVELRLLRGTDGSSDIDTPSVTVRPRAGGSYRVTVTGDGRTLVTVRSGDAAVVTPQGDQALTPGTTLVAQGPAASPSITTQTAIALDDFDRFNQDRDVRYQRALADERYVSSNIVGAADLGTYGRWVPDPRYGEVWVPNNVAADWAPYRDGRWVWEDSYAWTWVGYEPWGWAPYHYGSWYRSPVYGWCWYPPPVRTYVPWRPALVAFFAFGGDGFGLGWVPLAPFEPWHQWWGRSWGGNTTIINNNTTIVNNNYYGNASNGEITRFYKNAQYGVVTVPGQRFLQGRFDHATVMKPSQMRNVQIVRGALPVVPTTANLRYSDRPVSPQLALRPSIVQRSFAGETTPVRRVPFEQTRTTLATAMHAPNVMTGGAPASTVAAPSTLSDPWSRFGNARGGSTASAGTNGIAAPQVRDLSTEPKRPVRNSAASVPVTTGSAGNAWSRFDNNAQVSHQRHTLNAGGGAAVAPSYAAPTRVNRTVDAPVRPSRTYDAPAQPSRTYNAPGRGGYGGGSAPGGGYPSGSAGASRHGGGAGAAGQTARQATARTVHHASENRSH